MEECNGWFSRVVEFMFVASWIMACGRAHRCEWCRHLRAMRGHVELLEGDRSGERLISYPSLFFNHVPV